MLKAQRIVNEFITSMTFSTSDEEIKKMINEVIEILKKPTFECGMCLETIKEENMHIIQPCKHMFCKECLKSYIKQQITDGNSQVKCPDYNCKNILNILELFSMDLCDEETYKKSCIFGSKKVLNNNKQHFCCANCGTDLLFDDSKIKVNENDQFSKKEKDKIHCPLCNKITCKKCKKEWKDGHFCSLEQKIEEAREMGGRICPHCGEIIIKTKNCNHITCICGKHWCYACPLGHAFGAETKNPVYEHMTKVHKGYYSNPVD